MKESLNIQQLNTKRLTITHQKLPHCTSTTCLDLFTFYTVVPHLVAEKENSKKTSCHTTLA
jgi:hypothetical protein